MTKMRAYVIRQGDYLAKLAHRMGFEADAVWNDPMNAEIKKRRDPNVLYPGEILHVPAPSREPVPIASNTTNGYVAVLPKTTIRLTFEDAKGPMAHEPYVVQGIGRFPEKSTDGHGQMVIEVPVHIRECRVLFTRLNVVYPVLVGDMDPIDEVIGVRKRLRHLGHGGALDDEDAADLPDECREAYDRMAILAFQYLGGFKVTGELGDATRAELTAVHGS